MSISPLSMPNSQDADTLIYNIFAVIPSRKIEVDSRWDMREYLSERIEWGPYQSVQAPNQSISFSYKTMSYGATS